MTSQTDVMAFLFFNAYVRSLGGSHSMVHALFYIIYCKIILQDALKLEHAKK